MAAKIEVSATTSAASSGLLKAYGLELTKDGYIGWQKDNPVHPRNWSAWRKTYNTSVILLVELVTTMNGTAGTAVADQAIHKYNISQSMAVLAFTSTYVIGQGIGGIFFPPFSEAFGRKSLYIISTFLYCVFCVIAASVPSLPAVIIARFVTGVLSAIAPVVFAGSFEDVFSMQARVWMIFCWVLVGNVGLCFGPIFSTYTADLLNWEWVFSIAAVATGLLSILCLGLKESRPSLLLERQVAALYMALEELPYDLYQTRNPDHIPDLKSFLDVTMIRPIRLLFTEPIIIMVTFMDSVATTLFYLQAESLIIVYTSLGFSATQASLSLIPVALGCLLGFLPRIYDDRKLKKLRQQKKPIQPEDKLFGFSIGSPILAIALWWFAWTIPPQVHTHWAISMLALVPAGFALNDITFTLAGYLEDCYTIYAASAFAGGLLARSLLIAAVLPFTRLMYTNITPNVSTSILAAVGTLFYISPYVLIRCGKGIRKASSFARYSLDAYKENQVEDDMGEEEILSEPAVAV